MTHRQELARRVNHFTRNLLSWNEIDPERDLPWVFETNPYRVWISEIMLQQTRAKTVIPYYQRFIEILPDVECLANASSDQVLSLWSGLGYYTRARNLHRAAKQILEIHGGIIPPDFDAILALPGIGKSTAGAICALAFGLRTPILDGNAKRVYSRFHCVDEFPESARVRRLWELAELHTPAQDCRKYTQRIMDLGATICLPTNPLCHLCPVASSCCARASNRQAELPVKKRQIVRKTKSITMLIVLAEDNQVLLERRNNQGIWGGLWSLPEYAGELGGLENWLEEKFHIRASIHGSWDTIRHELTHISLVITPLLLEVKQIRDEFENQSRFNFFSVDQELEHGMPVPVLTLFSKILELKEKENFS